ncbi:hypothetical protein IKF92_00905 [Candidatus Saccharibacteria bacterium]|nr:hypothetical protein [Candidatus Saccharibacteria bacterium]
MTHTNKYIITSIGLVGLTILTGLSLSSNIVSAEDVVDNVSITVPISCTMSGQGMNSHTEEVVNGTYESEIGTTTIKVICNDNSGFDIYATGFTGDVIAGTNSNKLVGTSASESSTIDTGTATTAGNPDTSNWAMKLTATSGANVNYPLTIESDTEGSFSSYHTVPNTWTRVATRTAGTDTGTNAEGSTMTTTYAAYISKTQPADTYTGKVKYTLVHPHDGAAPIVPVSFNDAYATAGKQKLNGYYKMQDMSSSICSAVTLEDDESETVLIDSRDNKTYLVSKLKDGNCWMTQNLDHDIVTDGSVVYNSTTTDLPNNTSWDPMWKTYTADDNAWKSTFTEPQSYDPGDLYWSGIVGDNTLVTNGDPHYHIGNYYNWVAAVASNNGGDYCGYNQDANQSICPVNWTLPKSGNVTSSGSFSYLIEQYGWDSNTGKMENPSIWESDIKTPLNGIFQGSFYVVGSEGAFWSSMVEDDDYGHIYSLYTNKNTGVIPNSTYDNRASGYSVRCLAR